MRTTAPTQRRNEENSTTTQEQERNAPPALKKGRARSLLWVGLPSPAPGRCAHHSSSLLDGATLSTRLVDGGCCSPLSFWNALRSSLGRCGLPPSPWMFVHSKLIQWMCVEYVGREEGGETPPSKRKRKGGSTTLRKEEEEREHKGKRREAAPPKGRRTQHHQKERDREEEETAPFNRTTGPKKPPGVSHDSPRTPNGHI